MGTEKVLLKKKPLCHISLPFPQPHPLLAVCQIEKAPEDPRKNKDSSELAEIIGNAKPDVPPIASKNTRFKNQSRNK